VEDVNDEAFYRTLLNQISQGKIKIARVFALGGRDKVIQAAIDHDFSKRKALFVIDGDLDWVRGIQPPQIVGLHRHDAYCIENLLICEKALAKILSQEVVCTEDDAIQMLDLKAWAQSIKNPLIELFSAFATVHEIAHEIPTVSQGVGNLCTAQIRPRVTTLDAKKVELARDAALAAVEAKSDKLKVQTTYKKYLTRIHSLKFPLNAVSGKDFLLPLLDFFLQAHGCRIKRKSLRMRMATAGEIERFSRLSEAMRVASLA
jgi:hypothetical protein